MKDLRFKTVEMCNYWPKKVYNMRQSMGERYKPEEVRVVITSRDRELIQKVTLPNGKVSSAPFQINDTHTG